MTEDEPPSVKNVFENHLQEDELKSFLLFRITCTGTLTNISPYHIATDILSQKYDLQHGIDFFEIDGGYQQGENRRWDYAVNPDKIESPNQVIADVQELIHEYDDSESIVLEVDESKRNDVTKN